MKYVMFTNAMGLNLPVLVSDHATHYNIRMGADWVATSAGAFDIQSMTCIGQSSSLGLKPRAGDAQIIQTVLTGMEVQIYLTQDLDANLERRKEQIAKPS